MYKNRALISISYLDFNEFTKSNEPALNYFFNLFLINLFAAKNDFFNLFYFDLSTPNINHIL